MERIIKFRFYDTVKKEYQKDGTVLLDSWAEPFSLVPINGLYKVQERNECIVEQFTGLTDKKGVEIYEGDVDSQGGIIEWYQDTCQFVINYPDVEVQELKDSKDWCEIVSNIHENGE